MIYLFSKALTISDVNYKFFSLNGMGIEPFGKFKKSQQLTLSCSDGSKYDCAMDMFNRIRASDFFDEHPWLASGSVIDFEIDRDNQAVKININRRIH